MDIQSLHTNLSSFVSNYNDITDKFFDDQTARFIDTNEQQLDDGEDALGNEMPEYRNPKYAQLKQTLGNNTGKWDLRLTGTLRGRLLMKDGWIFSNDWKNDKFENLSEFGLEVWGVQPERLDTLIKEQITPDFIALIEAKILK